MFLLFKIPCITEGYCKYFLHYENRLYSQKKSTVEPVKSYSFFEQRYHSWQVSPSSFTRSLASAVVTG